MSLVGFRSMLVHECAVYRQAAGTPSEHGHSTGAWVEQVAALRCRFMENTGREHEEPFEVNVKRWRVFCEAGSDVQFKDRLRYGGADYEVQDVVADLAGASEIMRILVEKVEA
jgi:hypothetical protein